MRTRAVVLVMAVVAFALAATVPAFGGATATQSAASLVKRVAKALKVAKRADRRSKAALARARQPGPVGPRGADGAPGAKGETGATGPQGPAGPSASAYGKAAEFTQVPVNSSGGAASTKTSVVEQSLTIPTRSRVNVTATGVVIPEGSGEFAVQCTPTIRSAANPADEEAVGNGSRLISTPTSARTLTIAAIGAATRDAGSYIVALRCSDTLSQPSQVSAGSIMAIATADAG